MGIGNISIWQLLIVLLIVVLIFGTKRLRGMGSDLGSAIRDFRKGVRDPEGDDSGDGDKATASKSEETEDPSTQSR